MSEELDTPVSPPAAESTSGSGFAALGIAPDILTVLTALGYEEPTPIQTAAIPALLAGRDVLGQAATGTGKTAAFALPLLHRIGTAEPVPHRPRALVLVPTRELAMQVAEAIHKYGRGRGASVLPIYGGQFIGQQLRFLARGVSCVVATPGRALEHLERGSIHLDDVQVVVLDEADEMLNMGFAEDLDAILKRAPTNRQTALFSATLAPRILGIAERHLKNPARILLQRERPVGGELPKVRQTAYIVPRAQKTAALVRVLDMETPTLTIVFCRTRLEVDELQEAMNARGYRAEALHGGFAQDQRERVMRRFRSGKADVLIATDVAARGLDIDQLSHVVNYDCPSEPEAYVHRIGRTGRAGREGVAITLVEPREHRLLRNIESITRQKIALATIPTVADLHHRRLELTCAQLRETLIAGDLDRYRSVVESLASDLDIMDIAAAAVKLAHQAGHEGGGKSDEARDFSDSSDARKRPPISPARPEAKPPAAPAPAPVAKAERAARKKKPPDEAIAPSPELPDEPVPSSPSPKPGFDTTRLYVGAGRMVQLRPSDLASAIEAAVGPGTDVLGSIHIGDRFSIVEVRRDWAEPVIKALRSTVFGGKKLYARHYREG